MNRSFVSEQRFAVVVAAILICFSSLLGRLYYLHVHKQAELSQIVEENRRRFQVVESRRGNIVDTKGNLLATTKEVREVGVDPFVVKEYSEEQLSELARILRVSKIWLRECIEHKQFKDGRDIRWKKLADAVDEADYQKILELGIKGVYGNRKYDRVYPGETLAAHVLGYVNKEKTAVSGIEHYLDFYLKGQDGWTLSEKDGRRRELAEFRSREVPAVHGYNVELCLDMVVQHMAEKELVRIVEEYAPQAASIIVSDPRTGAILAMANAPSFDLNKFGKSPMDQHRNRAISDVYEPGSTFKIVCAAGVLNEELVTPETMFDCGQPTAFYRGREVRLPSDHHPLEEITVEDIVVKSSNRGAAQLGIMLGAEVLYDYTRLFGFGDQLGIGISGEVAGILHQVKDWDGLTISRLPMGHAISATHLQVHQSMAVIANGGVMMRPYLVNGILDAEGETIHAFPPTPLHRVVSTKTAKTMASMLKKVVEPGGTARRAYIEDFAVAGKTGTTQKIVNGRYSHKHHVGSFVGFFPASNPALVISVVVDEPQLETVGYGGVVAAPAFKNIAEQCIQYMGIPPEPSEESLISLMEMNGENILENNIE